MTQHKDTTLDEKALVQRYFLLGAQSALGVLTKESALKNQRVKEMLPRVVKKGSQDLGQWRDKAVVEAKQELREKFGIDADKKYKVHYTDKAIIAQVIEETPNED